MRFLFIDRVLELERERRIVAVKSVSLNEDFFAFHFPADPVMPGSLLIEAFAQAGTILLEASAGLARKALPVLVTSVKFRAAVRPGAEIRVELSVDSIGDEAAALRGEIRQRGELCATGSFGFVLAPMERFFPAEWDAAVRTTYRVWLAGATLTGFARHPLETAS